MADCESEHLQGRVILKIVFRGVYCRLAQAQGMLQYRGNLMIKIALSAIGVGDVQLFSSSGTRNAVRLRHCTSTSTLNSSH